jgi:hypothetical protein
MFYAMKQRKDGLHPWCKACFLESQRAYGQKNAEKISEKNKQYRAKNKEAIKATNAAYYAANKERLDAKNSAYYEANKEKTLAYLKEWQAANPEKVAEYKRKNKVSRPDTVKAEYERNKTAYFLRAAERRATKTSRTPEWADQEVIAEYYKAAKAFNRYFGAGTFHVDHIVPLKSKKVCGLHTDANLQMLLSSENLAKNNRFWPNMA